MLQVREIWASLVAQLVKKPPAMQETLIQFLGWEDPLEKGKATHSSILVWRTIHIYSKHPLPTTQEKTIHVDITRWSSRKSD